MEFDISIKQSTNGQELKDKKENLSTEYNQKVRANANHSGNKTVNSIEPITLDKNSKINKS